RPSPLRWSSAPCSMASMSEWGSSRFASTTRRCLPSSRRSGRSERRWLAGCRRSGTARLPQRAQGLRSLLGGSPSPKASACPDIGSIDREAVSRMSVNLKMPAHVEVAVARALLLGVLVTVLMSTSVAIGFEILSYIAFAALAEPRRRLIGALRSRIVIALLPFAVVVFIGIFYGAASWPDAV